MINIVDDDIPNWSKVNNKTKQQQQAKEVSSSVLRHKHQEDGISRIKDPLSGVEDPMDLLQSLDKSTCGNNVPPI